MIINNGLFDHCVLQRTAFGTSAAEFDGASTQNGVVTVCVASGGRALVPWKDKLVGEAGGGSLRGCIKGLPTGGPYTIELSVRDKRGAVRDALRVTDVLVGDLWLLAGQSNMQGLGSLGKPHKPLAQVRAFYLNDEWDVARDPLHTLWCAVDAVYGGKPGMPREPAPTDRVVGPGVSFGHCLWRRCGEPQGLLPCALGGTAISDWDPARIRQAGKSLYGAMLRRVRKNGGRVAGVLWYQGCSDAEAAKAPFFARRTSRFIEALRSDLGNPLVPVVLVQIARDHFLRDPAPWNSIQEQQRLLAERIYRCSLVPTIDLAVDDPVHIAAADQRRLGKRLAYAMEVLRKGARAGKKPISLKCVRLRPDPKWEGTEIVLEFSNVVGRLGAPGRVNGFHIATGNPSWPAIHHARCDRNRVILSTRILAADLRRRSLHYGCGISPYCNVTDEADRSLPVFGPLLLRDCAGGNKREN